MRALKPKLNAKTRSWTLNEARTRSEALKELSLKWLEEPVWPPENYDGLAQLRRKCGIPIAAGENVPALMDFERLMAAQAVDFVQPSRTLGNLTPQGRSKPMRRALPLSASWPRFSGRGMWRLRPIRLPVTSRSRKHRRMRSVHDGRVRG